MKTLRYLAPAVLGAALLGPAAVAQTLPPGHPPVPGYAAPPMAQPGMAPHSMAQMQQMHMDRSGMAPGMSMGPSNDELRRQEQMAWERERQQLIRQGHGERVRDR